jgi:hypothetical protein
MNGLLERCFVPQSLHYFMMVVNNHCLNEIHRVLFVMLVFGKFLIAVSNLWNGFYPPPTEQT